MATSTRQHVFAPPAYTNEISYTDWKKEVEFWQLATDVKEEKQGTQLFLSLTGKSREAVREISTQDISGKEGVKKVLEKLDTLWLEDEKMESWKEYTEFIEFKRPTSMDITEYINSFERLYNRIKKRNFAFPDATLAMQLMVNANISSDTQGLVMGMVSEITFKNISAKLKTVCGKAVSGEPSNSAITIKQESYLTDSTDDKSNVEEAYYTDPSGHWNRCRGSNSGRAQNRNRSSSRHRSPNRFRGGGRSRSQPPNSRVQFRDQQPNLREQAQQNHHDQGQREPLRNPLNMRGNTSRCAICGSEFHWVRDCPENREGTDGAQENRPPAFTMFTETAIQKCYINKLVSETLLSGLLDCGCTKTVCGVSWFENFTSNLTEETKSQLKVCDSNIPYKFGDNDIVHSFKVATLPVEIVGLEGTIETEIVNEDVPLLISKESMKKIEMVINFANDEASILGKKTKLETTSSGHYILPLTRERNCINPNNISKLNEVLLTLKLEGKTRKEKQKLASKLHGNFGHPTHEKMYELIVTRGNICDDEFIEILEELSNNCESCERYRKKNPRPVVGMALASEFNETIAMDLKLYQLIIILHIIDLATRYSNAVVVKNKKKETITDNILMHWISKFGAPNRILTDNGGEFNNEDMLDMSENLNTEVTTTAAESPWSNGTCERHNGIIASMLDKIMHERQCEIDVALAWAIMAKNCLHNVYGYSPNQLVFGNNPSLPSNLNDKIPALNGITKSKEVAKHLNAKHAARKAFIECEANAKIRTALRGNIRYGTTKSFEQGDKVYYKRKDHKEWRGPGYVVGKDQHQVLVKHGGQVVRVHPVSLRKTTDPESKDIDHTDEPQGSDRPVENNQANDTTNLLDTSVQIDNSVVPRDENQKDVTDPNALTAPPINSRIKFRSEDTDNEWKEALVISKCGKSTGGLTRWRNVKYIPDEREGSVNFEKVEWEYKEESALLSHNYNKEVIAAKQKEINNLIENNAFTEVKDEGQEYIDSRWVITEKNNEAGKVKTRLVAKGFQEDNNQRTDSPTLSKNSMRCIFALAAANGWKVRSVDMKSAFLQGRVLERELFLKPPPEFGPGILWKLNKAIYGLNDASREWYLKICDTMGEMKATRSKIDNAVFYWSFNGKLVAICGVHVDDFINTGDDDNLKKIINDIKSRFRVSSEGEGLFDYLGVEIQQDQREKITLSQCKYIQEITQIPVPNNRELDSPLNCEEKQKLRSLVGQMNWVANHSRPDIAFDACQISTSVKDATIRDLKNANKVVMRVKSEQVKLTYPLLGDISASHIICYTDASFKNLPGGASQGGYCIFIKGANDKRALLAWQSKKIKRVVKSTLAAETLALQEGAEHCYVISSFLKEITGISDGFPITIYTDNDSLDNNLQTSNVVTEKRLNMDLMIIRDMLERNEICHVEWVPNEEQLADSLTKKGASCTKLIRAIQGT